MRELVITDKLMSQVAGMSPDGFNQYPTEEELDAALKRRDAVRLYGWACYLPEADTPEREALVERITTEVVEATKRGEEKKR